MPIDAGDLARLVAYAAVLGVAIAVVVFGTVAIGRWRAQARRHRAALAASEAVSAALSEEALFLSAVLSTVDSVIVLLDREGRVRFVNERFEATFGVRGPDVVGRPRAVLIEAIAPCFADPEAFRAAAEAGLEARTSAPRSSRRSGVPAPDELESEIVRPVRRVLLFSLVPVMQELVHVGDLAMFRDVTEHRDVEAARERLLSELAARATTDALTGLSNRRAASEALVAEIERARRYERPLAVVLFDLDRFKSINDDLGHEAGDRVLRAFGGVLRSSARSTDVVARWGGEEFLAILPEADLEAASHFAERVRDAFASAHPLDGRVVTTSAGATQLAAGDDDDAIVRRADAALYDAKRAGRDRLEIRAAQT
jgi:diguanylate cyclase (GGDEF)-like protein/PAS domain S-box-containing protein